MTDLLLFALLITNLYVLYWIHELAEIANSYDKPFLYTPEEENWLDKSKESKKGRKK